MSRVIEGRSVKIIRVVSSTSVPHFSLHGIALDAGSLLICYSQKKPRLNLLGMKVAPGRPCKRRKKRNLDWGIGNQRFEVPLIIIFIVLSHWHDLLQVCCHAPCET